MSADEKQDWRRYRGALALGTSWVAGMVICTLIGRYADRKTGGGSLWTIVGMFAGLLYGAYETWKAVREMSKDDESDTRAEKP